MEISLKLISDGVPMIKIPDYWRIESSNLYIKEIIATGERII